MSEDREEQHKGFKVHDRRRFSESGEPRGEPSASPAEEPRDTATPQQPPHRHDHDHHHGEHDHHHHDHDHDHHDHDHHDHDHDHHHGDHEHHHHGAMPEINFPTFIISLCTQALAHLGEIPDPGTGTISPDLGGARQLIDILAMLEEKTRGNLDADEANLLEHALYDLRIKFVERAQNR